MSTRDASNHIFVVHPILQLTTEGSCNVGNRPGTSASFKQVVMSIKSTPARWWWLRPPESYILNHNFILLKVVLKSSVSICYHHHGWLCDLQTPERRNRALIRHKFAVHKASEIPSILYSIDLYWTRLLPAEDENDGAISGFFSRITVNIKEIILL